MRITRVSKGLVGKKVVFLSVLALLFMGIGVLAPHLIPHDPYEIQASYRKGAPSLEYLFGTDKLGRCIFSRVLMGARTSIFSAFLVVAATTVTGTIIGAVAGYYGGILEGMIQLFTDIFLAFPQMVFAIAVAGILGGSMTNAMLALGFSGWTLYARLVRAQVKSLKEEEYITAARLSGCSSVTILVVHMLPAMAGEILVNASIQMGTTILGFAGLSFLGLGVTPPQAEWGSMINEAKGYMQQAPWAVMAPGAALFVTVSIFHLLGDAFRDYFDIRRDTDE
ncbi:ABC transporter permease [Clostridium sp. E02]|uniref:ABC transporter permease n=1 Tax=Clostridium sp. E02 TaxID=2487134 RepID=UPI000F52EA62|nr:ABC transporter permease [Clostridium sp. E02]